MSFGLIRCCQSQEVSIEPARVLFGNRDIRYPEENVPYRNLSWRFGMPADRTGRSASAAVVRPCPNECFTITTESNPRSRLTSCNVVHAGCWALPLLRALR